MTVSDHPCKRMTSMIHKASYGYIPISPTSFPKTQQRQTHPSPARRRLLNKNMAIAQLAPAPRPIGKFPNSIAQRSETLVLKEKVLSLSGDSFDVKTADGNRAFEIKGETFTLSGRKHLLDSHGTALFDIRKEHFALHKTFYGANEAGDRLFEVKKRFQSELPLTDRLP